MQEDEGDRKRLERRELGHEALDTVEFLLQFAETEFPWPKAAPAIENHPSRRIEALVG